MTLNWRGVFPAATTQFSADHTVDMDGTLRHLDLMVDSGVHGLSLHGRAGPQAIGSPIVGAVRAVAERE